MSRTSEVSMAPAIATKKNIRPVALTAAAAMLIFSALLTFATLWFPRGQGHVVAPKERRVM